MKRVAVEIVKSTAKAHQVRDAAGRQGWVQARWLAKDGTVSAATFEKAVASAAAWKSERDAERAAREAYHAIRVSRETEKAIGCEVVLVSPDGEQMIRRMVWFPKSMMRDGAAPGWMIAAKMEEVIDNNLCGGMRPFVEVGPTV